MQSKAPVRFRETRIGHAQNIFMLKENLKKIHFCLIKLPILYGLILSGFILEFIVELPFAIIVALHEGFGRNKQNISPDRADEPPCRHSPVGTTDNSPPIYWRDCNDNK